METEKVKYEYCYYIYQNLRIFLLKNGQVSGPKNMFTASLVHYREFSYGIPCIWTYVHVFVTYKGKVWELCRKFVTELKIISSIFFFKFHTSFEIRARAFAVSWIFFHDAWKVHNLSYDMIQRPKFNWNTLDDLWRKWGPGVYSILHYIGTYHTQWDKNGKIYGYCTISSNVVFFQSFEAN